MATVTELIIKGKSVSLAGYAGSQVQETSTGYLIVLEKEERRPITDATRIEKEETRVVFECIALNSDGEEILGYTKVTKWEPVKVDITTLGLDIDPTRIRAADPPVKPEIGKDMKPTRLHFSVPSNFKGGENKKGKK